jgi:hypothetical protein
MESAGWLVEMHELGNEFQALFARQRFDGCNASFKTDSAIARLQNDAVVVTRLDSAMSP